MEARKVAQLLGIIYIVMMAGVLQFGQVVGSGTYQQPEGRVIDIVIEGIAQAVRS